MLNRLTYGPSEAAIETVRALGIPAWVDLQLHPETIDESGNTDLTTRENALFTASLPPGRGRRDPGTTCGTWRTSSRRPRGRRA